MTIPTSERPVTRAELAQRAHISLSTLDRARKAGLPHVFYGQRSPRFYLSVALPWLAQFGRNQRDQGGEHMKGLVHSAVPLAENRSADTTTEGRSDG